MTLTGETATACPVCWTGTNPVDWLTYYPPVVFPQYLVLAPNYILVWLSLIWVPFAAFKLKAMKATPDGRALLLAFCLFSWNVGSDLFVYVGLGRPVFEWYLLPAVPALAIGGAFILTRKKVPRWAVFAGIAAVMVTALLLNSIFYFLLHPQYQGCPEC